MSAVPVSREFAVRALGLYGPVALAFGLARARTALRLTPALLLGVGWTLPALAALQRLNLLELWWSFHTAGPTFLGMPVELYLGWACLWGALPVLIFRRLHPALVVAGFILLDLALMPLCSPAVLLGPRWMMGEAVAAGLVLTPATLLARWTLGDCRLRLRAGLQLALAGGLFLYLLPEVAFALRGGSWSNLRFHGPALSLALQVMALVALPGVSAVQEFASRGQGTPIPYDPPRRLVTTGIYRYVANPMQLSCTLILPLWGWLWRSPVVASAGVIAFVYSAGVARWDERQDLKARFGASWITYRLEVRDWLPRWRPPAPPQPAQLYIAQSCALCSQLRVWIEARHPIGLEILAAESHPTPLRRIRYSDRDTAEDGLHAFARALEHLHLGWALLGAAMRLPGLRGLLQVVADGVGFGERWLPACPATSPSAPEREPVSTGL